MSISTIKKWAIGVHSWVKFRPWLQAVTGPNPSTTRVHYWQQLNITHKLQGPYQVSVDAWQQHHISQSEVQSLSEHVLQRWQVRGLHFPYLRAPSGGRKWNWIHRHLGQSRPELEPIRNLRWLSPLGLRVWVSSAFSWLVLLILPLLFEFLSPYFVIIVDFDRFGQSALEGEDGGRELQMLGVSEVFFYSRGDAYLTESGPLAYLRDRKRCIPRCQNCPSLWLENKSNKTIPEMTSYSPLGQSIVQNIWDNLNMQFLNIYMCTEKIYIRTQTYI